MDAMRVNGINGSVASPEQASPALRTTEGRNAANAAANGVNRAGENQRALDGANTAAERTANRPDAETIRANAEAAAETKEGLLDRSVVSRDQDGDTVAVSRAAEEDLDESRMGAVTEKNAERNADKPDAAEKAADETARANQQRAEQAREARLEIIAEQREAREAAREKAATEAAEERQQQAAAAENQAQNIDSFAGVTNGQLEQYYLQGRISRNDYENEIEAREARLEDSENRDAMNAADMARIENAKENVRLGAEALAGANGAVGNDGMRGLERFEAARNASDQNSGNNNDNSRVNTGAYVAAVSDTVSIRTDDGAIRAAASQNKQNTDSLLRGEEQIQWDYR